MTDCTLSEIEFPRCRGRRVVADFGGGDISSNGGALLLSAADRRLGLLSGLSRRLSEESMSRTIVLGGLRPWTRSIQIPERLVKAARFSSVASHSVSKRPIWLVEAADRSRPFRSTMTRMTGSRDSRSASFTSSYPAKRLCQTKFARRQNADGRDSQAISSHHSARAAARFCLKISRRLRWRS